MTDVSRSFAAERGTFVESNRGNQMDCPACKKTMTEEDFGGIKVQVCASGCKGIWFDCGELSRLDESNEGVGQALHDALNSPRTNEANRPALACPKCGVPMHQHLYKSEKEVNVDECYNCGGFFLDSGEFKAVRDNHMSEQEESAYADKLLTNLPSYQEGEKDLQKQQLRNQAIAHFTRFLRLSYYVNHV
ncbi:MAG: zf-TFIIB domain-containing protein [Dokdonella sp.]